MTNYWRLGKWLDKRGIPQEWLIKETGLHKTTVGDLTNNDERIPSGRTMERSLMHFESMIPPLNKTISGTCDVMTCLFL
jgi:hypothetical protein